MKVFWLLLLSLPLVLCAGCGGDDDDNGPPPPPTDQEVLDAGWDAFEAGDLAEADDQFRELLARGVLLPEAHNGLGWRFIYASNPDSAYTHLSLYDYEDTDPPELDREIEIGLALVSDAFNVPQEVIRTSADLEAGWVFAHDDSLGFADIVALRAAAYYALAQFPSSLAEVQRLDPAFTADVGTPSGRAALAAKIEELQS